MLVELGVVEQRLSAVLEVLNDGVSVTEVAERFGVIRQSVHRWLRRYADRGLAGLVDQSTAPGSCPHQMAPVVEARIVEMRVWQMDIVGGVRLADGSEAKIVSGVDDHSRFCISAQLDGCGPKAMAGTVAL